MLKKTLTIKNKLGLHARASTKLIKHAMRYTSDIHITVDDKTANGKSIMGIMLLAANLGTEIILEINGPDEQDAMQDLETLINNKFDEE
ncbi:MAG: HPr family phosphocarrier protein [Gammaproteobacteria bacterium]|nr:HPr family phosphocarrier protein [Gammaproteobacteria bacterium]